MPSIAYNVSITAVAKLTAESQGFIDPKKIEHYMGDATSPTTPSTAALSRAKERGNIRYDMMIGSLGLMGNMYVSNVVATGANANTAPSTLAFRLTVEHGVEVLVTPNESSPGTFLYGPAAIKRVIARTLLASRTDSGDFYDPTTKSGTVADGTSVNAVRVGNRIEDIQVTAAAADLAEAESVITVTAV